MCIRLCVYDIAMCMGCVPDVLVNNRLIGFRYSQFITYTVIITTTVEGVYHSRFIPIIMNLNIISLI